LKTPTGIVTQRLIPDGRVGAAGGVAIQRKIADGRVFNAEADGAAVEAGQCIITQRRCCSRHSLHPEPGSPLAPSGPVPTLRKRGPRSRKPGRQGNRLMEFVGTGVGVLGGIGGYITDAFFRLGGWRAHTGLKERRTPPRKSVRADPDLLTSERLRVAPGLLSKLREYFMHFDLK